MCQDRAARDTGLNLNSTRPPLTWSPINIEKGETMLFLWKPYTGTAGFEPGTNAWLARQSGAPTIAPRPLLFEDYIFSEVTSYVNTAN